MAAAHERNGLALVLTSIQLHQLPFLLIADVQGDKTRPSAIARGISCSSKNR